MAVELQLVPLHQRRLGLIAAEDLQRRAWFVFDARITQRVASLGGHGVAQPGVAGGQAEFIAGGDQQGLAKQLAGKREPVGVVARASPTSATC